MNNSSQDSISDISGDQHFPAEDALAQVRRLLLEPEQAQLRKLTARLDNPKRYAEDISRILPEAIHRSLQDRRFITSLVPIIEKALEASVKRDLKPLIDALFPIIGPTIRRAVSENFRRMVQSLNQALEQSLSWQGLKWRIEAFRTGRPFAEVVLLHSLIYRVEQVFLIHKETGLMLQHVVAEAVDFQDADMVSGMLTAIQDFVQDSFRVQTEEALQTIQVGELTVWIERGPYAILAGVVRGNAPEELRSVFQDALEDLHLEQGDALESFKGDAAPFEAARHYLEACLQAQSRSRERRHSFLLWALLGSLSIVLGFWVVLSIRDHSRWTDYLEKLSDRQGIVVTAAEKRHGKYFISGLRDPLAVDPDDILGETELDPQKVIGRWELYYALHPEFILARSKKLLDPPETVSLRFQDSILIAEGFAAYQWIVEARNLARVLPGIVQFQEDSLIAIESGELSSIKKRLEEQVFFFVLDTSNLVPGQSDVLQDLASDIQKLQNLSQLIGKSLRVEIVGRADKSGLETENMRLSRERAARIRAALVSKGVDPANLAALSVGSKEPLREELTEQDKQFNRSVGFRIILNGPQL